MIRLLLISFVAAAVICAAPAPTGAQPLAPVPTGAPQFGARQPLAAKKLLVGIAANSFLDAPADTAADVRALELGAIRVYMGWAQGTEQLTASDVVRLTGATQLATRVLVNITGGKTDAPQTRAERATFARYAVDMCRRFPIWGVSVWNEPNGNHSWPNTRNRAETYERLVARVWSAVHRSCPGVKVLAGELTRTYAPIAWVRRMGAEYRRSGRTAPLMDGLAHHPFPRYSWRPVTDRGLSHYPGWVLQGDVQRLRYALRVAFEGTAQTGRTAIYWTELGYSTHGPSFIGRTSPRVQASRVAAAVRLAYCQSRVRGIFFFQLWDDPPDALVTEGLVTWQTGVMNERREPKPSYWSLARAIDRVQTGGVGCSLFPSAAR